MPQAFTNTKTPKVDSTIQFLNVSGLKKEEAFHKITNCRATLTDISSDCVNDTANISILALSLATKKP